MSRIMDIGLEELSAMLHRMGELAYRAVFTSVRDCLENRNACEEVDELSEALVLMANQVEDKAFEIIARFQPVASDLRTITSYVKIAYDFARFGRYALDISYTNMRLGGMGSCDEWITSYIRELSDAALSMIRTSIDSLRSHNPQLAEIVSEKEKEVDKMYFDFLDNLIEKTVVSLKCAVPSVLIVRYLERIADHATYICESIIYIATGRKVILR